jgi:hypothetical protein
MKKAFVWVLLPVLVIAFASFYTMPAADMLNGAWRWQQGTQETVWVFIDGYCSQTTYDKANKKFMETWGGPYKIENNQLKVMVEFHTGNSERIGQTETFQVSVNNQKLNVNNGQQWWTQADNGSAPLAGNWRIRGRLEQGKLVEMTPGPRKTLKLLSGTRFQWIAINPGVKGFYGTGGGTYTFANGKYTEHIEFFSRDSSRVGASLTFDGKVEGNTWNHSGLNSRGEQLNEVWVKGMTNTPMTNDH